MVLQTKESAQSKMLSVVITDREFEDKMHLLLEVEVSYSRIGADEVFN